MKTYPVLRVPAIVLAVFVAGMLRGEANYATPYTFTTLAGDATAGAGSVDGMSGAARFNTPHGVAVDSSGNVYVADTENHTIRKITTAGVVTTIAGTAGSPGSADGHGAAARFNAPYGITVDGSGNVYVSDSGNHTIRKITTSGDVTTFAGTAGMGGAVDGPGAAARFYDPWGMAVDGADNVYVADRLNNLVRKISPAGMVSTIAGESADLSAPSGVAVDIAGNVYVADTFHRTIRKIDAGTGQVTILAGSTGLAGSADGTGSDARFTDPFGVTVDGTGNLFITDNTNHTVRRITPSGVVTTLAGIADQAGSYDGVGGLARFQRPSGIAMDGSGGIYVADAENHTIRKITGAGEVSTFAGSPHSGYVDGPGNTARFFGPASVAVDASGNLYVADMSNQVIRKITTSGLVTTLAGSLGNPGVTDGTGAAARFNNPQGIAVDGSGNVYVADSDNVTIRKITAGGAVTTLAGSPGNYGSADGVGAAASFNNPVSVAVDSSGNVYVADNANLTIRKITPGGGVTTFAGTVGSRGSADGPPGSAMFNSPVGVAVDGSGTVYVADLVNGLIRKIDAAGFVTTLAGTPASSGYADGTGGSAQFHFPFGVAVDGSGNVYVADYFNDAIRKISPDGLVTTIGGQAGNVGSTDATGSDALFRFPFAVAVSTCGTVYVADGNFTIRRGVPLLPFDFNGDRHPDILWQNSNSGDRGFWLMDGTDFASWLDVGVVSTDWQITALADFNADGQTDILWENTATGDCGFWLMDGTTFASWVDIGIMSTDWHIAAAADFNRDGKPDILWENTVTGDRGFWLMDGTTFTSWVDIGVLTTALRIVGAADFNADGHTDIVWENTSTGKRVIWFMNGTTFTSSFNLGIVGTEWHIASVCDYNADGQPDILWENTLTGDRGFWLMNGTAFSSWVDIGIIGTDWHIAP